MAPRRKPPMGWHFVAGDVVVVHPVWPVSNGLAVEATLLETTPEGLVGAVVVDGEWVLTLFPWPAILRVERRGRGGEVAPPREGAGGSPRD